MTTFCPEDTVYMKNVDVPPSPKLLAMPILSMLVKLLFAYLTTENDLTGAFVLSSQYCLCFSQVR